MFQMCISMDQLVESYPSYTHLQYNHLRLPPQKKKNKTNMSPKKGPLQKERIIFQPSISRGELFVFRGVSTLSETNIAPENRHSQKEIPLPTIHFQGRTVSFREGIFYNPTNQGFLRFFSQQLATDLRNRSKAKTEPMTSLLRRSMLAVTRRDWERW